ncbi:MAG: Rne/Rng family ribonuclease [Parvibaculaceae bacterium]
MGNKMLIDAAHPEETRVVVMHGNRVEEFDFESEAKKQLRGNIYLAKVTRVEPSLQAAFVEYGGNRHGFLAFNEIHPDYYQIPVADREELLKEWAAEERADQDDDAADDTDEADETGEDEAELDASDEEEENGDGEGDDVSSDETVEAMGSEDALEEAQPKKQRRMLRSYKIQEVIKRRQVILIQVVKEERGNKGAALTTYLSLAGRYCVLMPNTARGGGISRKITNGADRKRLKSVTAGLDVPEGMGLIVRTAGAKRTKAEIKRDFEYLLRLWERVRDLTLESNAPALVYEEGSLVKRSIRDLYSKDIDSVLVEGDEAYREAKDFMRMLMPSHAKNVQPYKEREPIFQKYGIDQQLDSMFSPTVTLKSGGYLVINQTEALVAIDVNSGRSTKERNVEATAVKTNLEAAAEVARQFRLRDLAGLIVIDFIDMDENRNNRAVERKLKECLKSDRARIQVGRISHFGLLEMSRQRMRAGIIEGSTVTCPMCSGSGYIRSVESTALHVLRAIEAEAIKGKHPAFTATVSPEVAIYILNQKRSHLLGIEETYGVSIYVETDRDIHGSDHKVEPAAARGAPRVAAPTAGSTSLEAAYEETDSDAETESEARDTDEDDDGQPKKKRRRRRRGGRGRKSDSDSSDQSDANGDEDESDDTENAKQSADTSDEVSDEENAESDENGEDKPKRRRRRGRRGGRRNRRTSEGENDNNDSGNEDGEAAERSDEPVAASAEETPSEDAGETADGADEAPVLIAYSREPEATEEAAAAVEDEEEAQAVEEAPTEAEAPEVKADAGETSDAAEQETKSDGADDAARPARSGWWRRRSSAD